GGAGGGGVAATTDFVGTVKYAAPEVLQGTIDPCNKDQLKAADVFSMSLAITELLLEDTLWYGKPRPRVRDLICNGDRPTKDLERAGVQPEVVAVLENAWNADAGRRSTAEEFRVALEAAWPGEQKLQQGPVADDGGEQKSMSTPEPYGGAYSPSTYGEAKGDD
ncbi:unnamed protein product, partial [Symbiodinium sp. KB8]